MVAGDYFAEAVDFRAFRTERRGREVWRSVFDVRNLFATLRNNGMPNDTKRIGVGLRSVLVQSSPLVIIVVFFAVGHLSTSWGTSSEVVNREAKSVWDIVIASVTLRHEAFRC